MANILIVEDEADLQELVAYTVGQEGHEALRAASAEQAQALLREAVPHLILVDWLLPGMSGMDLVRWLRANERTESVPLIMLTARSAEEDRVTALEFGADDYMTKPFSPRELNARIRAVLRRHPPRVGEDSVEVGDLRLDRASHRVTGRGKPLELGPTEFRLLHFFMTHAERAYSRAQLLDNVWENCGLLEKRTVDVHIRRLRKVLEATGHDRFIQTVRGLGYRFSRGI